MYRILLVDDEALIREGVSENVQWGKYGYELAGSCENGREALEFIEENQVDVVMTDICMPYLDGMELSERLSEKYPNVKVIILSGYDDFEYAKKAIRYGVKEYLLKPITACEMGNVLGGLKKELDKERDLERRISHMKATYHKGQMLLYSDVIRNLITGSKPEAESRRELMEVGACTDAAIYRVAVVELDIYAKTDKLSEQCKKESSLMAFVLYNITQEIVKKHMAGEVCQGKDHRIFILFYADKLSEFEALVQKVSSEIIAQMNRSTHMDVNIGMGGYKRKMRDIYLSYEEAEEALEYHYTLGGNRIQEIESIYENKKMMDIENTLDEIILHVKENHSRKLEEDMQLLLRMLRDGIYDRRSAGTVLQRTVDLVDEARKLSEIEEIPEELQKENILQEILIADKLEEAVAILHRWCEEIGGCLDNRKNIGGKKYAVLAIDYIEKNYADSELSLNSVCSYLSISPSRFSSIFKTSTGTTFLEVLSRIRMQKAKELLACTDMKNYEIAERVGFNDPHYFSIAFKKTTGQSPTEYARGMRR